MSQESLSELDDVELVRTVEDLQIDLRRMQLENKIFEKFLLVNEPSLLKGMDHTLSAALQLQQVKQDGVAVHTTPEDSPKSTEASTTTMTSESIRNESIPTELQNMQQETGPRINVSLKTDLTLREIEEIQQSLEKFIEKSHKIRCQLTAEIEELTIRNNEVQEAVACFEREVIIGGVEKITGKIPAEKLVRFLNDWLKNAEFALEKLRLRTNSLRSQQRQLRIVQSRKEELGEKVHTVDFEKLRIENKNLLEKIEQMNAHLIEMKRINGKANLMLTVHKNLLQQQTAKLNSIKRDVERTEAKMQAFEKEVDVAEREVEKETKKYDSLQAKVANYQVPGVMEYIRKKDELRDVRRMVATLKRKLTIQDVAFNTYTKKMMLITGARKPKSSWYKPHRSQLEDMLFEQGSDIISSVETDSDS